MNKLVSRGNGIRSIIFPDGQPYITLDPALRDLTLTVKWPIRNPTELFELELIRSAADGLSSRIDTLIIPYLMGARSDRLTEPGGSIPIKAVATTINSIRAERVFLFDVHSRESEWLINNAFSTNNYELVTKYKDSDSVLIIPDAGAIRKASQYAGWNMRLTASVQCIKERNPTDGTIKLKVLNPDLCKDRNCVIIDDICDGGATFLAIADQIQPKKLTLIVTHGIFSKGIHELSKKFQKIITTDSFRFRENTEFMTCIPTSEIL